MQLPYLSSKARLVFRLLHVVLSTFKICMSMTHSRDIMVEFNYRHCQCFNKMIAVTLKKKGGGEQQALPHDENKYN